MILEYIQSKFLDRNTYRVVLEINKLGEKIYFYNLKINYITLDNIFNLPILIKGRTEADLVSKLEKLILMIKKYSAEIKSAMNFLENINDYHIDFDSNNEFEYVLPIHFDIEKTEQKVLVLKRDYGDNIYVYDIRDMKEEL